MYKMVNTFLCRYSIKNGLQKKFQSFIKVALFMSLNSFAIDTAPLLIEPVAPLRRLEEGLFRTFQKMVHRMIPQDLWESGGDAKEVQERLAELLPLFQASEIDETSSCLAVTYLYPAEYTHLARRYVVETLSKWLGPHKPLEICGGLSLKFQFAKAPLKQFFIVEDLFALKNDQERAFAQLHLKGLIEEIKQKLPYEFFHQIERNVHPIFMPRNEEEMIRNLIVLNSEVRHLKDPTQVSIHFDKQTDTDLTFTVLLVKIHKKEPLKALLEKSKLKIDIHEVRTIGLIKQKYPKESAVLRITLDKRPFFRVDYSLDLLKARQKVVLALKECIGEFRDFNGGIILKQEEAMKYLKNSIACLTKEKEFLLENYFYSLSPTIMPTILDPSLLKEHFELFYRLLQAKDPQPIAHLFSRSYFLFFALPSCSYIKETFLQKIDCLKISSKHLTLSSFEMQKRHAIGIILKLEKQESSLPIQEIIEQVF